MNWRCLTALGMLMWLTAPVRADVITDWNATAIDVMKAANHAGNPWSRSLAMMHVAMVDAVNTVQGKHTRYLASGPTQPIASPDAAAAAAARQVMAQLYPNQKAVIEQAYENSLKAIPDGAAKTAGIAIGGQCAGAVQAERANDGTQVPDTYRPIATPGVWVPTVLPVFAEYARAMPWVIASAEQFRPGPPPDLKSPLYARDYNETKDLGGAKSSKRTSAQTDAVKFWTQLNIGPAWQAAARQLSAAKGVSLADNARLFALLNMGIANTFINDWDAKFTYNFWRPVTAIRNGDMDGNDATEREAGWVPLNATPMHPEYPSQAAIVAGVAIGVLDAVFPDKPAIPVVATDLIDPKLMRQFANVRELAQEHMDVRVWGGIHFRNSLEVGYDMGQKIAAFLVANAIKPAS